MQSTNTFSLLLLSCVVAIGCGKEAADDKPESAAKTAPSSAPGGEAMTATPAADPALSETTSMDRSKTKPRGQAPMKTERGFAMHDVNSAPEAVLPAMNFPLKTYGFVPHLTAVMADSPALANSYYMLQLNLRRIGSLSPPEDNIVQMSIAMENECQYCVAGHTLAGKVFFKSPDEQIEAIRAKAKLPEPKLNALRDFALQVYESQGRVTDAQFKTFIDAGYTRAQALDVVANVAAKVMSNYANQVARTPLDEQIKPMAVGLPFAEARKTLAD